MSVNVILDSVSLNGVCFLSIQKRFILCLRFCGSKVAAALVFAFGSSKSTLHEMQILKTHCILINCRTWCSRCFAFDALLFISSNVGTLKIAKKQQTKGLLNHLLTCFKHLSNILVCFSVALDTL